MANLNDCGKIFSIECVAEILIKRFVNQVKLVPSVNLGHFVDVSKDKFLNF